MPRTKRPTSSNPGRGLGSTPLTKKLRKDTSQDHVNQDQRSTQVDATNLSQHWRLEDMPGADVFYLPDFIGPDLSKDWYTRLNELDTWYHPTLKVYGKEVFQSRSIAAYARPETEVVKYSGHQVDLNFTYPEVITEIQSRVEEKLGVTFTYVMLNRYADGHEYIGKHRDAKQNKVIASLSLGAERTLIFSPDQSCPGKPEKKPLALCNGSLLVMQGDTQKYWKHEIPKEPRVKAGRISLTFRQLQSG